MKKTWKKIVGRRTLGVGELVAAAAVLICVVITQMTGFTPWNMTVGTTGLEAAYMIVQGSGDRYYTVDNGKSRIFVVEGDRIQNVLSSNSGDFYQVEKVFTDPADDSFYVQSVNWDESGYLLESETILHYSSSGRMLGTALTISYEPSDEVNKHRVFDPRILDGKLTFIYADDREIRQQVAEADGSIQTVQTYDCGDAWVYMQNFAQRTVGDFYGIHKTGEIWHYESGEKKLFFSLENGKPKKNTKIQGNSEAKENDGMQVLYALDVSADGTVYYTDLYHASVQKVTGTHRSETVVDAASLAGKSAASVDDRLYTVTASGSGGTSLCTTADNVAVTFEPDGTVTRRTGQFQYDLSMSAWSIGQLVIWLAGAVCFVFVLIRAVALACFNFKNLSLILKIEIILLPVIIGVATGVAGGILRPIQQIYNDTLMGNLKNIALVGSGEFEEQWLESTRASSGFMNADYTAMSELLHRLTTDKHDYDNRYGAEVDCVDADGRAYAVVFTDNSIGTYYPLDESNEEAVKEIYQTKKAVVSMPATESGGTFIYGRAPILDADGNVIAVFSVAQDSYSIQQSFSTAIRNIFINVLLAVVVLMFLLNEFFVTLQEKTQAEKKSSDVPSIAGKPVPVHILRLCAFGISFVLNMTSSFLSVYTSGFWTEGLGISQALAGAFPLFANSLFVTVSALFVPTLHEKIGFRFTVVVGIVCSCGGDFLAGISGNYISIVLALLLNGLGFGLLMNSISISIGRMEPKEKSQTAFSNFNAGCIAGINSGMIVGSFLAGVVSYNRIFYVTSVLWALLGILFAYASKFIPGRAVGLQKKKTNRHISWRSLMYNILLVLPYAIIGSFIYYYIPIYTSNLGYSEKYCSVLMVLYAFCGILLSTSLSRVIWEKMKKWSVYLAIVMALAAWLLIAASASMTFAVIAMLILGISFSFGLNVLVFTFMSDASDQGVDGEDAMSVYNFFNSAGQTVSSVVCGLILGFGMLRGMIYFSVCCVVFMIIYGLLAGGKKKGVRES